MVVGTKCYHNKFNGLLTSNWNSAWCYTRKDFNASSQSEHLSTILHYNPEKLFVGKSVLYLFLNLHKATEILSQFYIKCFNKVMNHNPENLLVVTVFYIYSFLLVKATEFCSQFCIKCFNKVMNHNPENLLNVSRVLYCFSSPC